MWGTCWSAGGFDQSEAVIGELVGQEVNPHTNNPKKLQNDVTDQIWLN